MKIGLLMPSILMAERFSDRIFAPKDLFVSLADGLVARGHDVYVYSTSNITTQAHLITGDVVFEQKDLDSVKIRAGGSDQLKFRLNASEFEAHIASIAYKHAREHKLDMMHIYMDSFAQYLGAISDIPTVVTMHDPLFPEETLEGWRYRYFRHLPHVAISNHQKSIYGEDFNCIDVVYHGLDLHQWEFSQNTGNYLAFAGRMIAEKGVEDAFTASEQTQIPLHLATSDNYTQTTYYKEHIEPNIKNPLFTFTGFLGQKERAMWLLKAKALLFPIKWEEPFGMVMIEAMACGTPVIAYSRGSVPEIIKDGVTGFIIDPNLTNLSNSSNLVIKKTGIDGLIEAINRIGEIDRAACRRHVEEHFSVEKMVKGYEKVYKKLGRLGE